MRWLGRGGRVRRGWGCVRGRLGSLLSCGGQRWLRRHPLRRRARRSRHLRRRATPCGQLRRSPTCRHLRGRAAPCRHLRRSAARRRRRSAIPCSCCCGGGRHHLLRDGLQADLAKHFDQLPGRRCIEVALHYATALQHRRALLRRHTESRLEARNELLVAARREPGSCERHLQSARVGRVHENGC